MKKTEFLVIMLVRKPFRVECSRDVNISFGLKLLFCSWSFVPFVKKETVNVLLYFWQVPYVHLIIWNYKKNTSFSTPIGLLFLTNINNISIGKKQLFEERCLLFLGRRVLAKKTIDFNGFFASALFNTFETHKKHQINELVSISQKRFSAPAFKRGPGLQ